MKINKLRDKLRRVTTDMHIHTTMGAQENILLGSISICFQIYPLQNVKIKNNYLAR